MKKVQESKRKVIESNLVEAVKHVLEVKEQAIIRLPNEEHAKWFYNYLQYNGCEANYLGYDGNEGHDVEFLSADSWEVSFIGGAYA